jgi:arylsulfatase A-like enzyme
MHAFGYDSYLYKLNLMHIDKVMGILIDNLDKLGYLNDTAIAITSDHGNYKANKFGNILPFYERSGLRNFHPRKNPKGNVNISEFSGVGMFNFKRNKDAGHELGWSRPAIKDLKSYGPKRVNLFEELFKINGTRLMYYREDDNTYKKGTIHMKRMNEKTGKIISGTIEYKGTGKSFKTRYASEDGENDIFGFTKDDNANKLVNGNFYSIDDWLDATHHLDYALYPNLIPRHFKNPRSSDIIISTKGDYTYNVTHGKPEKGHIYKHDIGLRESTIVPLIIAGTPEIPQKEISYCKTTDITPTLITLLGKKPHESVVGKSLI